MTKFCIDIHEQQKHIDSLREALPKYNFEVEVKKLDVADYHIGNVMGVEHKAPDDFVGSVKDGRVFQQATELSQNFTKSLILVDGPIESVLYNRYIRSPNEMWGAIGSLWMHYHTPVMFCGKDNLVSALIWLALKASDGKVGEYNPIRRGATVKERQLHLISSLPGIGPGRARKILDVYKSPMNALTNLERWEHDVDGIGPTIKSKVTAVVTSLE